MSIIKLRKSESGLAHPGLLLLVVVVIALIGFAGYRVYTSNKGKETASTPTTASTKEEKVEQAKTWSKVGYAVKGKYADADVVQIAENKWRLYYAVQPEVQPNNFEVYSATSTDGKKWKQESGTRKTMATFPDVVKLENGKYRMYYQSAGVIKSAISSDGLSFSDESGTRVGTNNSEGLNFDNVAAPTVAQLDDDSFVMVYRGSINKRYAANVPNQTTNVFMWATSDDGLTFKQKGLALDSRNSTLSGQLDGADLSKWDDEYKVFMTSYAGVFEASFDGKKFGEPKLAFAGNAKKQGDMYMGQPPGDPTLAEIDGTWFMYYGATGDESGILYATYK